MKINEALTNVLNKKQYNYVVFNDFVLNNKRVLDMYISSNSYRAVMDDLKALSIDVFVLGEYCLYGMEKIHFIEEENVVFRLFSRPSIRSLVLSWVPFNHIVEQSFLKNKKKKNDFFYLSQMDEFFYLICKNVFNSPKGVFEKTDIERIEKLEDKVSLKSEILIKMFESVFFKFTSTLLTLLEKKQFNGIYQKYISFKGY